MKRITSALRSYALPALAVLVVASAGLLGSVAAAAATATEAKPGVGAALRVPLTTERWRQLTPARARRLGLRLVRSSDGRTEVRTFTGRLVAKQPKRNARTPMNRVRGDCGQAWLWITDTRLGFVRGTIGFDLDPGYTVITASYTVILTRTGGGVEMELVDLPATGAFLPGSGGERVWSIQAGPTLGPVPPGRYIANASINAIVVRWDGWSTEFTTCHSLPLNDSYTVADGHADAGTTTDDEVALETTTDAETITTDEVALETTTDAETVTTADDVVTTTGETATVAGS